MQVCLRPLRCLPAQEPSPLWNTAALTWKGILIFGRHIITPSEDKEDLDLNYYILSRLPGCLCESGAFGIVSLPTRIPSMHYTSLRLVKRKYLFIFCSRKYFSSKLFLHIICIKKGWKIFFFFCKAMLLIWLVIS